MSIRLTTRVVAISIIVAGMIDPAISVSRSVKPVVSIMTPDSNRSATTLRLIERALDGKAMLVNGSIPSASARIVIGSHFPTTIPADDVPTFIVPSATAEGFHVEDVSVPHTVPLDSRVSISARISRAMREDGRSTDSADATLELREDGALLSQSAARLMSGQRSGISLNYVPTRAGAHRLELRLIDGRDTLSWTRTILALSERWSVLFYDPRPSWLSTFVRRALERDTRFRVTSMIRTSTNVSRRTPGAARSLTDMEGRLLPDVLIVGAPEALTRADLSVLERISAIRGIAVVILPDHLLAPSAAVSSLLGTDVWIALPPLPSNRPREISRSKDPEADSPTVSRASSQQRLFATSIGFPSRFPVDAEPIAVTDAAIPIIWKKPLGYGEIIVSAAFDAWRFRDRSANKDAGAANLPNAETAFDIFWRNLIAGAAWRRAASIAVELPPEEETTPRSLARSGVIVRSLRDSGVPHVFLAPDERVSARDSATSLSLPLPLPLPPSQPTEEQTATLLPTAFSTVWRAVWPAWATSVQVSSESRWIIQAISAADTVRVPVPANQGLVDTPQEILNWRARASGGRLVLPAVVDSLDHLVTAAIGSSHHRAPWYPMRSPWWIVPLVAALGMEWWLRRSRGLP